MAMGMTLEGEFFFPTEIKQGTLAIDLGASTTVVAFQGEEDTQPTLLDLPPISRVKGEIPSLIWYCEDKDPHLLIGQEVLNVKTARLDDQNLASDFKRWIGSPTATIVNNSNILPEKAGELLLHQIWQRIPNHLRVKRLVLTAPVDTYRAYRNWLNKVCSALPVSEIALVDEPTAAAMGAGLPPGSKLLVIDIGGSTIDLSLVALEGGEGRAEPVAQLLRFNGEDLEGKSKQILRCAKVLGKSGLRLGGRDIDRWIANYLCPEAPLSEMLLNTAEKLKCRLSQNDLKATEVIIEELEENSEQKQTTLQMSRLALEELLEEKGFLKTLNLLLEKTLTKGKSNGCSKEDLRGVVLVGGGARIPLIRNWLKNKTHPAPLLTPPPVEAVAIGALSLTPGVTIQDVLHQGVSLRCWDRRSNSHCWHPLFMGGQTWPTSRPLEIILAASKINQKELEVVIGGNKINETHEIIYLNGVPTVKEQSSEIRIEPWQINPITISLSPMGQPGEDCLSLKFKIDKQCQLRMEGIDLRSGEPINEKILGSIR